MTTKGFADNETSMETPNVISGAEKHLKSEVLRTKRVDINILKSKLQENESKELKKNVFVLTFLVLSLGALGIYLSL